MRTLACLLALVIAPPFALAAEAQDVLNEARRHYDAAAYNEALSVLSKADTSSPSKVVEVEQYRAFCLIALGRMDDAKNAIAALVEADPFYVPPASPRILSFVSEVRRDSLPAVARGLLDSGRTAYSQKRFEDARGSFQLLLRVLADPAMQGRPETADLRAVAEGFVDLVAASNAHATVRASNAPAAVREPIAPKAAEPSTAAAAPVIVPAVAIRQVFPQWLPDESSARMEFLGRLRLTIGADGKVKSATIEDPSHPNYDARLMQAAPTWLYKPATRNGEPVESEKIIEVRLRRNPAS
jgi:hypothetical protein